MTSLSRCDQNHRRIWWHRRVKLSAWESLSLLAFHKTIPNQQLNKQAKRESICRVASGKQRAETSTKVWMTLIKDGQRQVTSTQPRHGLKRRVSLVDITIFPWVQDLSPLTPNTPQFPTNRMEISPNSSLVKCIRRRLQVEHPSFQSKILLMASGLNTCTIQLGRNRSVVRQLNSLTRKLLSPA